MATQDRVEANWRTLSNGFAIIDQRLTTLRYQETQDRCSRLMVTTGRHRKAKQQLLKKAHALMLAYHRQKRVTARGVKPLKKRPLKMARALFLLQGDKYLHFGLEAGLKGSSIEIIQKDALLFQCISVCKDNPKLLPRSIRRRVYIVHIK